MLTKTKEPVIEEHTREGEPGNVSRSLAGVEPVWRAIESAVLSSAIHHVLLAVRLSGGMSGVAGGGCQAASQTGQCADFASRPPTLAGFEAPNEIEKVPEE